MDEKKNEETPKPKTRRTRGAASASKAESTAQKKESKPSSVKAEESEKNKEPSNLAESVAYLKAIGLKKVSNKTFINEEDLAAFLDGDFTNINKVRMLGFIQILEREYPVKLGELRQKYLEYYAQNKPEKEQQLFVHAQNQDTFEWKRYLPWVAGLLLLAGILWYLNSSREHDLSSVEAEQKAIVTDENSDILQRAKTNLKALEANDTEKPTAVTQKKPVSQKTPLPQSDRAVPFVMGAKAKNNQSVPSQTMPAPDAVAGNNSSAKSAGTAAPDAGKKEDDLDLDAMVKEMVQEYNITDETTVAKDHNLTPESTRKTAGVVAKTAMSQQLKKEKQAKKVTHEKRNSAHKAIKPAAAKMSRKSISDSKLYIVPHKKSWVGVIYLDNYTKKDFLIRKRLKLDPSRPQLIVVGQKDFEIFNNGYSYRFRGKGPIRFVYKNGDIMEISNREFKRLSKGASW